MGFHLLVYRGKNMSQISTENVQYDSDSKGTSLTSTEVYFQIFQHHSCVTGIWIKQLYLIFLKWKTNRQKGFIRRSATVWSYSIITVNSEYKSKKGKKCLWLMSIQVMTSGRDFSVSYKHILNSIKCKTALSNLKKCTPKKPIFTPHSSSSAVLLFFLYLMIWPWENTCGSECLSV